MDWFRWWHGSVTDPKFQLVAHECKLPLASVIGLWAILLEKASQEGERGELGEIDFEVLAFHSGISDVVTPCNAMQRRGLLHVTDGQWSVTNWEKRQPKREREDDSSERVARHRAKKAEEKIVAKQGCNNSNVAVTPCNASVTPSNAQIREEEIRVIPPLTPPSGWECPAEESESDDLPIVGASRKKSSVQLKTWLSQCRDKGEKPISGYKPVFEYAEKVGLPAAYVELAWNEFYRRHGPGGSNEAVKKSDWRRHFLNCVEGNWQKLWYVLPDGGFALTTTGIQAERAAA